jgi:hypothetical protein
VNEAAARAVTVIAECHVVAFASVHHLLGQLCPGAGCACAPEVQTRPQMMCLVRLEPGFAAKQVGSIRQTCSRNCARTTRPSPPVCAQRTASATGIVTLRPRVLIETWIDETEPRTWYLFECISYAAASWRSQWRAERSLNPGRAVGERVLTSSALSMQGPGPAGTSLPGKAGK